MGDAAAPGVQPQGMAPPPTMSDEETLRVKAVAAHVAASANPARFQAELLAATRNNPNFDFLRPGHAHNAYHDYCVGIFRAHASARQRAQQELVQRQQQQQQAALRQRQEELRAAAAAGGLPADAAKQLDGNSHARQGEWPAGVDAAVAAAADAAPFYGDNRDAAPTFAEGAASGGADFDSSALGMI